MDEAENPYVWSQLCGWGLTLAVAAMGVAAVFAATSPTAVVLGLSAGQICVLAFATIAALSVASANNHAAHAMAAISADEVHWPMLGMATACAIGFATTAGFALHMGFDIFAGLAAQHGMQITGDGWVKAGMFFIAFAKPATSAVIVGRQAIDKAARLKTKAEAEAAAERAAERAFAAEQLAADRRAAAAANANQPQPAAQPAPHSPTGQVVDMKAEKAARELQARALIAGGLTKRNALAEQTGLSKHRCAQLLDELAPGWNERPARAAGG